MITPFRNAVTHDKIVTKLGTIKPANLPSPHAVALKIIQASADPDTTTPALAEIIGSDPPLLAELLFMVNSPFFGMTRQITSASHAVVILGNRALRNFALCFSAREMLRPAPMAESERKQFWEDMLRRAVSARLLAEYLDEDIDEAFTIGVLQDLGMLALLQVFPAQAPRWKDLRLSNPEERYAFETAHYGVTHEQLSEIFAQTWSLPEQIALPILYHHQNNIMELSPNLQIMCRIATVADWMTTVFSAADKRLALARSRKLAQEYLAIDQSKFDEILRLVSEKVEQAASAFGISVTQQPSISEILRDANRQLVMETQKDKGKIVRLEKALAERERLAEELQEAYERLSQLAFYDPLTALINRRRFEEAFRNEVLRHSRSGKPLSLVILDLDGFKQLNDSFGHGFGDQVLQSVASAIKGTLRTTDIAARIGGEEICVILPETAIEGGVIAAERLRRSIEELKFEGVTAPVQVSASLGGATWTGKISNSILPTTMKAVLDAADQALYESKRKGRNCVSWDGYSQKTMATA